MIDTSLNNNTHDKKNASDFLSGMVISTTTPRSSNTHLRSSRTMTSSVSNPNIAMSLSLNHRRHSGDSPGTSSSNNNARWSSNSNFLSPGMTQPPPLLVGAGVGGIPPKPTRASASNPNNNMPIPTSPPPRESAVSPPGNLRWSSNSGFLSRVSSREERRNNNATAAAMGGLRKNLPGASAPNLLSLQQQYSRTKMTVLRNKILSSNAGYSSASPDSITGRPKLGLSMITTNNSSNLLNKLPRTSSRNGLVASSKYGASAPNLAFGKASRASSSGTKDSGGGNARWGAAPAGPPMKPNVSMNLLVSGRPTVAPPSVGGGQPLLKSRWNSASVFDGTTTEKSSAAKPQVSNRAKMALELMKATGKASQFRPAPPTRMPPGRTVSSSRGLGLSRRVAASAPSLVNVRRTATTPSQQQRSGNAEWTPRVTSRQHNNKLSWDLLQSSKGIGGAMLNGSNRMEEISINPRWDSGSGGNLSGSNSAANLSGLSLGTVDQRSTIKLLPKRRKSKREKKKKKEEKVDGAIQRPKRTSTDDSIEQQKEGEKVAPLFAINVAPKTESETDATKPKVDTPLNTIRRTVSDEIPHQETTVDITSTSIMASPLAPVNAEMGGAMTDLMEEVTAMLNSSSSSLRRELPMDGPAGDAAGDSPGTLTKAALNLATLEINRCARLALREEHNVGPGEPLPESFLAPPENFMPTYLGCFETIPEYKSENESLDCISVDETVTEEPEESLQEHTFDDGVSQLSHSQREEDHPPHAALVGDSKLKLPARKRSRNNRRGSADSGTSNKMHELAASLQYGPASGGVSQQPNRKGSMGTSSSLDSSLARPQRKASMDTASVDSYIARPQRKASMDTASVDSSYAGLPKESSMDKSSTRPQRKASIETSSMDSSVRRPQRKASMDMNFVPATSSTAPGETAAVRMPPRRGSIEEPSIIPAAQSKSSPFLLGPLQDSSVEQSSVNAPFQNNMRRNNSCGMEDDSEYTAASVFSARNGGASMFPDFSENSGGASLLANFSEKNGGASLLANFSEKNGGASMLRKLMPDNTSQPAPVSGMSAFRKTSGLSIADGSMHSAMGTSKGSQIMDASHSSRSSKKSTNMFGSITNDMVSLLTADIARKPKQEVLPPQVTTTRETQAAPEELLSSSSSEPMPWATPKKKPAEPALGSTTTTSAAEMSEHIEEAREALEEAITEDSPKKKNLSNGGAYSSEIST